MTLLAGIIGLLLLAWGWDVTTSGTGAGSLPWVVREQGLYLSGLLSIATMSLAMVLATRPVALERPLGGMDRIYRVHKWSGILAAIFALGHWLIEMSDDLIKSLAGRAGRPPKVEFDGLLDTLREAGEEIGEFAIYVLLAMVVLTLVRRFPYKFWRPLHRVMPALYLLLAFHAAVLTPLDYWSQPIGWLLAVLLATGSVAAVQSLTGRIGRERLAHGTITAVSSPTPDVTEVTCRLDRQWHGHRAGQFAFVCFDRLEGAHPFTIACADRGDRSVTFQIKALGDYTRGLARRIAPGQSVRVEGPYGRFELQRCDRDAEQIWIAGGIGITPFLAWLDALRADPASAPTADLHYCTRDTARDPFVGRLEALCAEIPGISLHVHDSSRDEALSAGRLAQLHGGTRSAEVWFCGPRGFAEQLRDGLQRTWRGRLRFHQEAFEMR